MNFYDNFNRITFCKLRSALNYYFLITQIILFNIDKT